MINAFNVRKVQVQKFIFFFSWKDPIFQGNIIVSPSSIIIIFSSEAEKVWLLRLWHRGTSVGFHTGESFLPARNFMEVIPKIEKSKVFKILRDLPKGGILHAHDTAIVSLDYKLYNLTYRSNLYICETNDILSLKFFKNPDNTCDWQLLSDVRQDPKRGDVIDEKIKKQMTMVTEDPKKAYNTVDKAWRKFNSIFVFLGSFINYKPIYEDHFYQGLQEAYDDNIMYMELRSTLPRLYDLDGNVYGSLEVAKIHKEVSER